MFSGLTDGSYTLELRVITLAGLSDPTMVEEVFVVEIPGFFTLKVCMTCDAVNGARVSANPNHTRDIAGCHCCRKRCSRVLRTAVCGQEGSRVLAASHIRQPGLHQPAGRLRGRRMGTEARRPRAKRRTWARNIRQGMQDISVCTTIVWTFRLCAGSVRTSLRCAE